jgi:hypothetical protein
MSDTILVVVEQREGTLNRVSYETLTAEQALAAETGEQLDALALDQAGEEEPASRDGSGVVEDEVSRDLIEELTESGPEAGDEGVAEADIGGQTIGNRVAAEAEGMEEELAEEAEVSGEESEDDSVTGELKVHRPAVQPQGDALVSEQGDLTTEGQPDDEEPRP